MHPTLGTPEIEGHIVSEKRTRELLGHTEVNNHQTVTQTIHNIPEINLRHLKGIETAPVS